MTSTTETIRYAADVVLIAEDHVLLIERDWPPHEGAWALPGGHVDPGETALNAAARELLEETGIPVPAADLRHIGRWDAPGRDPRGRYATDAYVAVRSERETPAAGTDARAARWWPLSALPDLAFDHAAIVAAAVRL